MSHLRQALEQLDLAVKKAIQAARQDDKTPLLNSIALQEEVKSLGRKIDGFDVYVYGANLAEVLSLAMYLWSICPQGKRFQCALSVVGVWTLSSLFLPPQCRRLSHVSMACRSRWPSCV